MSGSSDASPAKDVDNSHVGSVDAARSGNTSASSSGSQAPPAQTGSDNVQNNNKAK